MKPRLKPVRWLLLCLVILAVVMPGRFPDNTAVSAAGKNVESLEEQAFKQAAALVAPSVVRVQTVGGLDQVGRVMIGTGPTTGVVVSPDGYIISSAFNFVSKPTSILVQLSDGRRLAAKTVATDHSKMLTLLKIDAKTLIPAQAAAKSSIKVGQWSIALGKTFDGPFPSMSVGIVSALDRIWGRAIQTDAKISPVNYGGPLVSIEGKVQGILVPLSTRGRGETAGVEWYDSGIGFAIPMEDVYAAVKRLKSGKDLHAGLMGISFKGAGLLGGDPVIDRVRSGSPAAEAGFKIGDRIVELDGQKIQQQSAVKHALGKKYAGDTVTVAVTRGGKTIRKKIKLVATLVAYQSAYLGILPVRESTDAAKLPGVGVRYLFADSPAVKVLKVRDRILKFNGKNVSDAQALLDFVSRLKPKTKVTLVVLRDKVEKTVQIELASIPNKTPSELRPTAVPPPEKPVKKTGRFTVNMPKHQREYWAYVPQSYNPAHRPGLMVWLHPSGDTMEAAMFRKWKRLCDRWNILIVAPKAGKLGGWTPSEATFVKDAVDDFKNDFAVDPARVFLHSFDDGNTLAFQMAFKDRDQFRGLCAISAPMRTRPAENSPDYRLQFHFVCGDKDRKIIPLVTRTVSALRRLKFPVSFTKVKGLDHNYPTTKDHGEILREIARWADCLDRI